MNDVTVISNVLLADGIGRQGIGLIGAIQDSLKVNAYQLPPCNYKEVPKEVMKVLAKPFDGFGKVAFWTFILGLNEGLIPTHQAITSPLKMAYSMFESDRIPSLWVKILNTYYDMVVVPDAWVAEVYQASGVKIPAFVVPLGILIEEFLAVPLKATVGEPFTFGMSAGLWERKNHNKLLQAFKQKFGNNPKFKLKLHGRFGSYKAQVEQAVKEANLSNVELLTTPLSQAEYLTWMQSLDCYAFPSQGEGFSVTPREAMALGIPCLLAHNSAQMTITNSGLVQQLRASRKKPAKYEVFGNQVIGSYYDCQVDDLADQLVFMVDNYDTLLRQAPACREWAQQYLWSSLKPLYLNLLRPQQIELAQMNSVDAQVFKTSDKKLYAKMKELFKHE
jgi:glycosyltransferase involved in cell wall biosynthesis